MIHAGSLTTIQAFLKKKVASLDFEDCSFELRIRSFLTLDDTKLGLQRKAQTRALQSFSQPALLLCRQMHCVALGSSMENFIVAFLLEPNLGSFHQAP